MTNRSFSLTHPEPSTAKQAPRSDSFQKRDYASEAITHWLDAKIVSHDLDEAMQQGVVLSERVRNGELWLRERGPSNPDYKRAQRQHDRLCRRQSDNLMEIKWLYVKLYLRVCNVHGCLNQVADPDKWIRKHGGGGFQNDVISIWHALQPERKPPFRSYPPPDGAYYVESGFTSHAILNAWMTRQEGAA